MMASRGSGGGRCEPDPVHPALLLNRAQQLVGGNADVLVPPRLRGLNKKVGNVDPVDTFEISTRQIAQQRVIGVDQRCHSAHGSALGRDPVRELFVPKHPTPPAWDPPPTERCRLSRRQNVIQNYLGSIMVRNSQ